MAKTPRTKRSEETTSPPRPTPYTRNIAAPKSWEPEEDLALKQAIEEHGSQWKKIASLLPGRTEAMCRNRYQRMQAPLQGKAGRNLCTACGQIKRGHTCTAKATTGGRSFAIDTLQPQVLVLPAVDATPEDANFSETEAADDDDDASQLGEPSCQSNEPFEPCEFYLRGDFLGADRPAAADGEECGAAPFDETGAPTAPPHVEDGLCAPQCAPPLVPTNSFMESLNFGPVIGANKSPPSSLGLEDILSLSTGDLQRPSSPPPEIDSSPPSLCRLVSRSTSFCQ